MFVHQWPAERPARCGVCRELAQIGGRLVTMDRRVYAVIQVEWQCVRTTPDLHRWHDAMYEATWAALMGEVPSGEGIDADLKLEPRAEPNPPFVTQEQPDMRYTTCSFAAVLNPTGAP